MNKKLSRLELYGLVWSKPMTTLAREFNLSDNGLRKICKKNEIPLPNVGYWAKVKYGYKPPKPKLSKKSNNEIKNIDINVYEGTKGSNMKMADFISQINTNKKLIFQVQHHLTKLDQLVLDTKEELEIQQRPWDDPQRRHRKSKNHLNISVSTKELPRSLRIFDNIVKNLRILNYQVECNFSGTQIISYDNLNIKISLREKNNATFTVNSHGWRDRLLTPNGKLSLKLEGLWSTREITDTENVKLEEQIPKILAKIEELIYEKREWKMKCEVEKKERERLEETARVLQKAKDDELKKFKDFFNSAHRWREFMILKEYYEMVKSTSQENETLEMSDWLAWANEKLDWYNPTLNLKDKLLEDVDKEALIFKRSQ